MRFFAGFSRLLERVDSSLSYFAQVVTDLVRRKDWVRPWMLGYTIALGLWMTLSAAGVDLSAERHRSIAYGLMSTVAVFGGLGLS